MHHEIGVIMAYHMRIHLEGGKKPLNGFVREFIDVFGPQSRMERGFNTYELDHPVLQEDDEGHYTSKIDVYRVTDENLGMQVLDISKNHGLDLWHWQKKHHWKTLKFRENDGSIPLNTKYILD